MFNAEQERRKSESTKWNTYPESVIPMWVADSDYAVPDAVVKALKKRLEHPVLGYGEESEKLKKLIVERLERLYDWKIKAEWICFTPGVVSSLNICRAIMGESGSNAITATPIYPHLINPTPILNREMKFFEMVNVDGRYTPGFSELEKNIDEKTRMLIICNPHNPVGTVYSESELDKFAKIAKSRDLLICSDDVHSDLVFNADKPYRPIATLSQEISERTITLMAASKTFNIAGLNCSYAIIENAKLRRLFKTQTLGLVGGVNILGFVASEAAYEHGESWLLEQIEHLKENVNYCYQRINESHLLSMNKMEATYLAWVDATELNAKVVKKGFKNAYEYLLSYGIAVSDGEFFGDKNFIRLNLATTKATLKSGLDAIEKAIKDL